jgi:hypothetical protein
MDLAQVFIFDIGWIFFTGWAMALAALSIVAFGRDLISPSEFPLTRRSNSHEVGLPKLRRPD